MGIHTKGTRGGQMEGGWTFECKFCCSTMLYTDLKCGGDVVQSLKHAVL